MIWTVKQVIKWLESLQEDIKIKATEVKETRSLAQKMVIYCQRSKTIS